MARGQDTPARTGGEINPYVQQSMQQSKQLASNRLVSAIQEAGATQRQTAATESQERVAGAQMATQRGMQAAQLEADDKRAAEAEIARRDDRNYNETIMKTQQDFQAKQGELEREHQKAMATDDREYLKEIEAKREALRRVEMAVQARLQEQTINAQLSVLKAGKKQLSGREKAKTILDDESKKFDRDKEVYELAKKRVAEDVKMDKRLDYPVSEVLRKKLSESKSKALKSGLTYGPIGPIRELLKVRGEMKEIEGVANPTGILQDQLDKHNSKVSVENITPEKIHILESTLQVGQLSAENIRSTLGVIEGMKDVLEEKRNQFSDKDKISKDFWDDSYRDVIRMRDAVEGLQYSPKKIAGSEQETVGARVRAALGPIYQSSLGGQAAKWRDMTGMDFDKVFDEMTKPLQVPSLLPVTPGESKYEKEYRESYNNMYIGMYPELGTSGGLE